MDIGPGIAIAGVWVFAGMLAVSKNVTNSGSWLGLLIASIVTAILI